jgi:hypothetical protein
MELDILSHAPTRATIMFGMNDVGYVFNANPDSLELENRRKAIEDYKKNIDTLIMQLTEAGIKVTLLSPTIYDETVKNKKRINVGKNAALKKCTYILEEKAARFGTSFVNFYNILDSINNSRQSLDSTFTIVGEDRTHPGIDGHFVMTYQFLISQDVPSLVSEFVLDASKMEIVKKQNCNLLKIRQLENGIAFTLLEKALPFPYPNELVANEWVPFEKMLNNEILKITNLRSGQYYVKIDETVVDTFSVKQLHNGINLVKYDHTPQYIQANLVAQINEYRRIIETERIRSLGLMEYGWLKDNPDASIDEKEILLKEKLDPHNEAGWYSYTRTQADNFIFYLISYFSYLYYFTFLI